MSLLVAVKSCEADRVRGLHQAIRETWGKDLLAILLFFMGEGATSTRNDEVIIAAKDDYNNLPFKTRAILKYFLAYDYDHIFLCDTDSYVIPYRLWLSGFENCDYLGVNNKPLGIQFHYDAPGRGVHWAGLTYPWHSGGFGYFLSRKAAEFVVEQEPDRWAEDMWVGSIMGQLYKEGKIRMANMAPNFVSWHHSHNSESVPDWQRRLYRENR